MKGIGIETTTVCTSCSHTMPLNAVVELAYCGRCGLANTIGVENWVRIVQAAIDAVIEDETDRSIDLEMINPRRCRAHIERESPRFPSGAPVDVARALEGDSRVVVEPVTHARVPIRPVPEFLADACPMVTHLLGEDEDLLPGSPGPGVQVVRVRSENAASRIGCPSCGAALDLEPEMSRTPMCRYCSAKCYLPDALWRKLRPSVKTKRWYIWCDERRVVERWRRTGPPAVDEEGNLYFIASGSRLFGHGGPLLSITPRATRRWKRADIDGLTVGSRLSVSGDTLLLWVAGKHSLQVLSLTDGSLVEELGGAGGRQPAQGRLSLAGARTVAFDSADDTILAYGNYGGREGERSYFELRRYHLDGRMSQVFSEPEPQLGVLGRARAWLSGSPLLELADLGDHPRRFLDADMKLIVGADGSYFFQHRAGVSRYARSGKKLYYAALEGLWGEVCGGPDGRAYAVVGATIGQSSTYRLMRISPGGGASVLVDSVLEGEAMSTGGHLALTPDGTLYWVGPEGALKEFSLEGELLSATSQAVEGDPQVRRAAEVAAD